MYIINLLTNYRTYLKKADIFMNFKFIKTQTNGWLRGINLIYMWFIYSLYLFESSESLFFKKDSIETKNFKTKQYD